jgi:PA-IL-like protein
MRAIFGRVLPVQILLDYLHRTTITSSTQGGAMSTTWNATLRRVSGLVIATGFFLYLAAPTAAERYVSWMSTRNIVINGDVMQKTGGCQGCEDAGAISQQMLSGDGYVQFVPGETNTFWYAGLTRRGDAAQHADMDFAFRFNGAGHADVIEGGAYKGGDTSYAPGDLFRIAIAGGRVQYVKNGAVVYESQQQPRFPLRLALSLGTVGTTLRAARIETNGTFNTSAYGTSGPYYDEEGSYGPTFAVSATQRWTDTGIDIHAGDTITFDAYGTVRLSSDPNDVADPLGSHQGRRAVDAPLQNASAGALIARIGSSVILIGDHRTITRYPLSGRLYLGVNDDYLNDNSGQYTVSVNVDRYQR